MSTILIIERSGNNEHTFVPSLEHRGFEVSTVNTGKLAISRSKRKKPDLIVLDAASLGTSGNRIAAQIRESLNGVPIIHVRAAKHAVGDEKAGPGDVSLDMPFTPRKLINRVKRLLPGESDDVLAAGPIKLDVKQRMVHVHGAGKRITPKCAGLLELFLRHPGETLNRGFLMKKVWKTDYVGDTRTLDVHVRWLREAIERRPANPNHIVTVRGIGYRFVPEPGKKRASTKKSQSKTKSSKTSKTSSKSKVTK